MSSVFSKGNSLFEIEFPNLHQDLGTQGFNIYKSKKSMKMMHIKNSKPLEDIVSPSGCHSTKKHIPAKSGIYRFEIHTDNGNLIYIGKAVNLRTRYAIYLENVRHLLLIHEGYKTKFSKHPFRCIHYALAKAAIEQRTVNFCYHLSTASEDIDRLEFKEISLEAAARIQANRFHSILNEMPALNNMNKEDLSEKWRAVQHAICNPCTL